jgi:hypothetical protein
MLRRCKLMVKIEALDAESYGEIEKMKVENGGKESGDQYPQQGR